MYSHARRLSLHCSDTRAQRLCTRFDMRKNSCESRSHRHFGDFYIAANRQTAAGAAGCGLSG